MKKIYLLLFLVFSVAALHVSAENILVIKNPQTGESAVFKKGSFLVFEIIMDQGRSTREGIIRDIHDSSLVFDNAEVSLSRLNIIAGSTRSGVAATRAANAVGNALVIAGTTTFNCGLDFFSYGDYYYWPIGGTVWVAGACLAGLGYVLDWVSPFDHPAYMRNYRGWEAHITSEGDRSDQNKNIIQTPDSVKVITPESEVPKKDKKKGKSSDDVYGD